MWSRENFSFAAVALSTGYAMWTLFTFKVWADLYDISPTFVELKPPVVALFLVFLISLINRRNIEPMIMGTLVGISGGVAFFLWLPSPSVVYYGTRIEALANFYSGYLALTQTAATCVGLMVVVMVGALLLAMVLRYLYLSPVAVAQPQEL